MNSLRILTVLAALASGSSARAADAPLSSITDVHGQEHGLGLRHKPAALEGLGEQHVTFADCGDVPDEFDLRDLGTVSPVKDQGQAGTCWAFSQTGSLESALLASGAPAVNLSEQELVSCDKDQWGTQGGLLNGFKYQITHGQGLESDFPYTATDARCKQIAPVAKGVDYVLVGQAGRRPTLKEVQCAIYKSHTVPWITVSANNRWGSAPSGDDAVFSSCGSGQTNHAIGAVGWKTVGGKVYIKEKNSWGVAFGSTAGRPGTERGYAMQQLGCDNLGEEVGYIRVAAAPGPAQPPHVKLPMTVLVAAGDGVLLGVPAEAGVRYQWSENGVEIQAATDHEFYAMPAAGDSLYKLVGKNAAGTTESTVKVQAVASFE